MGGEGAPSPWAGPISILRDMGGTAEAEGRLLLAQKPVEALSSSDDEGLTFSIRRQQASRQKVQDRFDSAVRAVHPTALRLESQFEAAGTPSQPAFSFPASQPDLSSTAAASSSQSSAGVQAPATAGGAPAMAASQPAQPLQQPPLMSHPLDLEQNEGKDAYLFSNPTFQSYLDPVSDEDQELMSACTTPRSALKQQIAESPWLARVDQFIRSPLSADSSPSHAAHSKPAASRQLMPEVWQPQAAALLGAPNSNTNSSASAAYPSGIPSAGKVPQHGAAPAGVAAVQQDSTESSSSFPVHIQPSKDTASCPAFPGWSPANVRPPSVPALRLAAQQGTPPPAESAASMLPHDSSPSHATHTGVPAESPQPAPPSFLKGVGAVHQSPVPVANVGTPERLPPSASMGSSAVHQSPVVLPPSMSVQSNPFRAGHSSPGLPQSSARGGPPVSMHPSFLPSPARGTSSPVSVSAAPPADAAGRAAAARGTPDLASPEQVAPGVQHSAQVSEGVSSTPVPVAVSALQQSPQLGFPSIGSTPAAQTIQGMCSLGTPMQPQLSPAPPHFMPRASAVPLQQHGSPALGSAGSPGLAGSLGVGSTPLADTIKALEAAGGAPVPLQSTPWQGGPDWGSSGSPNLGSMGTTPAVSTIKALQQGLSTSKSVSILASGCSDPTEAPLASSAGHSAPSSIAEDSISEKQTSASPRKGWALRHWVQLTAMLALVISPAALLAAGHVAASSASGRERLASGAYGSGAASFGRCVQHMHPPEALAAFTAGHVEYAYQPRQGSAPHVSEELACFVTVAAGESQQWFSAAAEMAAKASQSLHAHSVSMAARLNGLMSPVLHLCGGPAKLTMQSMRSMLEGLCPACMAPCMSAGKAIQQLSVQHGLRLGSSEAVGSKTHPAEQVASWAPAKPSKIVPQLLSASRALLQLVPEPVTAKVSGAWALAGTWLHMCAAWQPSQQPQLTALHSAVFLAHDSANIALHSLKRAAGCAFSAANSISAKAVGVWKTTNSLLQYASLAAMSNAERDAHLASKTPHDAPLDSAALEQAPAKGTGIAGWLGGLWEGKSSLSASTKDRPEDLTVTPDETQPSQAESGATHAGEDSSAAAQHAESEVLENSSGLSHVQLDNGGIIKWDGQPGQAGQPVPSTGSEAGVSEDGVTPDDSQPDAIEAEQNAGLQHTESAEGGTITWAGQTEQQASEAVDASLESPVLDEDAATPSDEQPAVVLSHTQTEDGGSVTWTGQAPQPETQHETAHLDIAAAEVAGSDTESETLRQAGGGETDQDPEASGSSGSCSVPGACQSEVEDHTLTDGAQPAVVQHTEVAAESLSEDAAGDDSLNSSGTGDVGQVLLEPAPGSEAASAGAEHSMGSADAPDDSISREGGADVSHEGTRVVGEQDSSDDSAEGRSSSRAEDIAAALADAVHTLEEAHEAPQPDQDRAAEDEGAADVAHSHVPAAALNRLSKLAETVWTALTLIAAVTAALGLAAAAAFLIPASQQLTPRKTLQSQESLDPHGNIFRAALAPPSGSRILVYRGTPLPRTPSVSFREPLTDCQPPSEPEQESPAVTPRQAGRQSRRKTQSSCFAAERENESPSAPTPRRSSLRSALRSASPALAPEATPQSAQSRPRRAKAAPVSQVLTSPRRTRRSSGLG